MEKCYNYLYYSGKEQKHYKIFAANEARGSEAQGKKTFFGDAAEAAI